MAHKRIILLYITEVSGHHSAALAIEKALRILQPDAEILSINAFNYTNPISEKIVNRLYMGIIKRTPQVWDYLYDNPAVIKKIDGFRAMLHRLNSPKLKNLFEKFNPDAVACTQAFPCGMVADFKKTYNSRIPLIAVLTDYVPHSYWIHDAVDYYISPSEEVAWRLMKKGVPAHKINSFGIPFDLKFNEAVDRTRVMQKMKLNPHERTILIMGGGQGLGPINTIIGSLEKVRQEIQEIIITGTNKKLHNSIKTKAKRCKKRIINLGYVNNVHELMSVADIIITKPGGITTAEALVKKLPMIIVRPLPGQEANNTAYLTKKGAAIKLDDPREINQVIEDILSDQAKLKAFSEAAGRISKPQASMDIAKLLLQEVCADTERHP
jgi:processive 1,2-diacylglycerol beta-glucosyltransferase